MYCSKLTEKCIVAILCFMTDKYSGNVCMSYTSVNLINPTLDAVFTLEFLIKLCLGWSKT